MLIELNGWPNMFLFKLNPKIFIEWLRSAVFK